MNTIDPAQRHISDCHEEINRLREEIKSHQRCLRAEYEKREALDEENERLKEENQQWCNKAENYLIEIDGLKAINAELLEACESGLLAATGFGPLSSKQFNQMKAAIAKAATTGE